MFTHKQKVAIFKKALNDVVKRHYQTPVNRWKYHYGAGDDYFEQQFTYIERMNFSQPFSPSQGHKNLPEYYYPEHVNDFRYNYNMQNIPNRFTAHSYGLKYYNNYSFDSLMHGNEWNDMIPDYQIEEPIESNHYIQHAGHKRSLYLVIYFIIFMFCKSFYFYYFYSFFSFFNYKLLKIRLWILWLWYLRLPK